MVKAYLRYELAGSWGVIASANCNVCYDRSGKHLLSAALENVSVWNVKQAVLVSAPCGPRQGARQWGQPPGLPPLHGGGGRPRRCSAAAIATTNTGGRSRIESAARCRGAGVWCVSVGGVIPSGVGLVREEAGVGGGVGEGGRAAHDTAARAAGAGAPPKEVTPAIDG